MSSKLASTALALGCAAMALVQSVATTNAQTINISLKETKDGSTIAGPTTTSGSVPGPVAFTPTAFGNYNDVDVSAEDTGGLLSSHANISKATIAARGAILVITITETGVSALGVTDFLSAGTAIGVPVGWNVKEITKWGLGGGPATTLQTFGPFTHANCSVVCDASGGPDTGDTSSSFYVQDIYTIGLNPAAAYGNAIGVNATLDLSYARSVPEASTWAMLLIGFAGLGFAGYRRARASHAV